MSAGGESVLVESADPSSLRSRCGFRPGLSSLLIHLEFVLVPFLFFEDHIHPLLDMLIDGLMHLRSKGR